MASALLKLDGRTAKGKKWKEHLDSGQALKQGKLLNSKLCSYCNTYPDTKVDTIKCMSCADLFHCSCLLSPLKPDYVKEISENPCLFWCCLDCLSLKNDNEKSATNPGNEFIRKSDLEDLMTFFGNTVNQLKSDIVQHVDSKIENAFNENLALPNDTIVKSNCDAPILEGDTASKSSYAEITNTMPDTSLVNANTTRQTNKEVPLKFDNSKNVVLLKPNEGTHDITCNETIKLINSSVEGLGIDYCRPRKSGVIALKVSDENKKDEIISRLNNNSQLSSNYKAQLPQDKLLPKVTVTDISSLVFDACDQNDNDAMKRTLINDILNRNSDIKKVIENSNADEKESIEVIFIKKIKHKDGNFTYTAAMKVTPKVRSAIHVLGDKLFIYLNRCKVFDRFYVTQCYHCQKVGHTSQNCNDKSQLPICRFCSKRHNSHSCEFKNDTSAHCCANCLSSTNSEHKLNAKSHIASSPKCPYLQRCMQQVEQKTIKWMPKN